MRLCVYAIMRDEAPNIAEWAETTADADLRFVLDTGSTDNTVDELRLVHGIQTARATFEPFRFDDARNTALALAPEADLYLRLDADERLPEGWRQIIEDAYQPTCPRYRYRVHNTHGIWDTIVRDDLHWRHGFRWKYPTHEILTGPAATIDISRLIVEHTSPPERRTHHLTNLDTLYSATIEYPGDHRMAFYYARELWYAGNWETCRDAMLNFLDLPHGWGPERCEAYRILAAIDYHPERWIWKAIGESPDRREPWVDLARHYLAEGNPQDAAMAMYQADNRTDDTIYTTDAQCWGRAYDDVRADIEERLSV